LALLTAVLFTSLIGFLLGITCLRLRGEYLAITTVAFGEIVQVILTQWEAVSGGPEGFLTIPKAHLSSFTFDTPEKYYYLTLGITILIMILTRNLTSSKLGRSFRSVKDDILAANILGIDTTRVKIVAFVLSAAYSGLAGSLYAHYSRALLPDYFNLSLSVLIFMGTLYGPIVGAVLLTVSFELLRALQVYQMVIYGVVVLLITIFAPEGLVGIARKMFRKKPAKAVQT
jgi:branched-chain amino acid transport system permease protein